MNQITECEKFWKESTLLTRINRKQKRLDHESYHRSPIERLLYLISKTANTTKTLKFSQKEDKCQFSLSFHMFSDFNHQRQLEHNQGHIELEGKYPYHGAHGRLGFDHHVEKLIWFNGITKSLRNQSQLQIFHTPTIDQFLLWDQFFHKTNTTQSRPISLISYQQQCRKNNTNKQKNNQQLFLVLITMMVLAYNEPPNRIPQPFFLNNLEVQ